MDKNHIRRKKPKTIHTQKIDYIPYHDWLIKKLNNKKFAAHYLSESFKESSEREFHSAIKDIIKAQGGVKSFANKSSISRQHLYRIFSGKTSPTLETLRLVLNALGFTLEVTPSSKAA